MKLTGRTLEERLLEENHRLRWAITQALDHFTVTWDTDAPERDGRPLAPIDWKCAAHRMAMSLREGLPEGDEA